MVVGKDEITKKNKVPRWGVHDGVRYNPKRSILKVCPICNRMFLQYDRGYKIYCSEVCRRNAHREQKRITDARIRAKRDKYEHAQREAIARREGLRSDRRISLGTDYVPRAPKNSKGKTDYAAYHQKLATKLNRIRV